MGYGYSGVKEAAFLAFNEELNRGEWGRIDLTAYLAEDGSCNRPICEVPAVVALKLWLGWGIGVLAKACATGNEVEGLEQAWDNKQRAFMARLTLAAIEGDAEAKKCAARVQASMTDGGGLAQINYSFDAEVDFGRKQVRLAQEPNLRADLTTLGLLPSIEEIRVATENLAPALGRAGSGDRKLAPSQHLAKALSSCVAAFNGVHVQLDWFVEAAVAEDESRRYEALLEPLDALLERSRTEPAATPAPVVPPAEEPPH